MAIVPTSPVFELTDSTTERVNAQFLLDGRKPRDLASITGKLAHQFERQNRGILRDFGVRCQVSFDGDDVHLRLKTGTRVGALPLLSPTTGQPDYGLVIKPRFGWSGIGAMLSQTGWRVVPNLLKLPELPRSDRKVPPWVLSSVILRRIEALLSALLRRFELVQRDHRAPRGQVRWAQYASTRLPRARFLQVPCRYPALSEDRQLLGAIHFTLRKHRAALASQRHAGPMVLELLDLSQRLLTQVLHIDPRPPTSGQLQRWQRQPLRPEAFSQGLSAIEWTVDERGLAGLGDRSGLAWLLPMEEFFEAWLEHLASIYCRHQGAQLRRGRTRETLATIHWKPPYSGSQNSLIPDLIIDAPGRTIIIDAKYKSHWEELGLYGWNTLRDHIRESHRDDLLQALAYANLASTPHITTCLIYPCRRDTYESLKGRNRLVHYAQIPAGPRRLDLILTALPMDGEVTARELTEVLGRTDSLSPMG